MNVYDVMKLLHPVKTTAHEGVNVQELVKTTFPQKYNDYALFTFDWSDLDGVLDYLYGIRETLHFNTTEIIKLIESNCEVKK